MKRFWSLILAAALCVSLTACGEKKTPFDPEETTKALMEAPGVFSETLERLDGVITQAQYGLGDYLEVEAVAYRSTGATAEEAAVIRFGSEEDAKDYETKAAAYLEEQREANVDYRPQEMPKLDKAVVERRGNTFLILVAADYDAAEPVLG